MAPFKSIVLTASLFAFTAATAQDTIQKETGEYLIGKVLEVGSDKVTYKKKGFEDGPAYSEDMKAVSNIRYSVGRRDNYKRAKLISSVTYSAARTTALNTGTTQGADKERLPSVLSGSETGSSSGPNNSGASIPQNPAGTTKMPNGPANPGTSMPAGTPDNTGLANGPVSNQYRIEHLDKKYTVNGEKVSIKAVDKLLAKSTNPSVVVLAKSAKLLKNTQKAMKIISYPSTITSGFASIGTFSRMYNVIQDSGATFTSCKDFGLTFLGTITGPITSRILKNRRDKMYDKAIDLYNFRN